MFVVYIFILHSYLFTPQLLTIGHCVCGFVFVCGGGGGGGGGALRASLPCEYMSSGVLALSRRTFLVTVVCGGTAERQAGDLVLVHPLVPHGLPPCPEGAGAPHAAGHDDVLQQVLGPEGYVTGLGHV